LQVMLSLKEWDGWWAEVNQKSAAALAT